MELVVRSVDTAGSRIRIVVDFNGGRHSMDFPGKDSLIDFAKQLARVSLDDVLGAAIRKLMESDVELANLAQVAPGKRVIVTETVVFEVA